MEIERVQDIACLSKDTIPEVFIRSENEQPIITTVHGVNLEVPVIDMSELDEQKLTHLIVDASQKWGMFQIINHGIPDEIMDQFKSVGKEFFELPHEEKEVYAKAPGTNSVEGYGTSLQKEIQGKKGWVDHLFHKIWPPSVINYKFWPKNPPSYRFETFFFFNIHGRPFVVSDTVWCFCLGRKANEEYAKSLHGVVDKLFKSLSVGLGLEETELKEAAGGNELVYLLKINYYPPCPRPDLALGVVAHTDMSCITILVPNDVQGLQASRDGHWYDVKYIPNALVIHIGDQIEVTLSFSPKNKK